MNKISTQVWFLRHGKTPFNYENSNYDDFIDMLCNGRSTPLLEDPGIDFESLLERGVMLIWFGIPHFEELAKLQKSCTRNLM